jgi:hypothetical protein
VLRTIERCRGHQAEIAVDPWLWAWDQGVERDGEFEVPDLPFGPDPVFERCTVAPSLRPLSDDDDDDDEGLPGFSRPPDQ